MTGTGPHSWTATDLWSNIKARTGPDSDSVRLTLQRCMPPIETILFQGGTAPLDFTLHDSEHAFRVAQRMVQLIPPDVLPKIQAYELSLLLLSAYLHDIGMTPERRRVSDHYKYLLTGDQGRLQACDIDKFQAWLDDEEEGIIPPLSQGKPTAAILSQAEEITTHYCRFRHNDWSEEWIRSHMATETLSSYATWLDDLVELCRSHHYGYAKLRSSRFDAKIVGSPAQALNLRYLAMLLRTADVLEFDPERTPEVIFRHREVSAQSLIFWWKDRQISFALEDKRVIISARPTNARLHRAIEYTIQQVESELGTCKALADGINFEKCPGLSAPLPHRWDLSPAVFQDVQPNENSYEYIDGSFRPDTRKLLQLLSGTELYGNTLVAVRELLQNAFDAVREQIAYTRLLQPNPSDTQLEETFQNLNTVNLRVEPHDDGFVLICSDTGVGMTKSIIRDHFLVSGSSRRHDVLDLERRSKSRGFSVGRTGEFGIGVLSYFMLAKRVLVRTKRSQESGDSESLGWQFETEGVGSFGELRRIDLQPHGTEVLLYLRPEVTGDQPLQWYEGLCTYLQDSLIRIPCKFAISSRIPSAKATTARPGWVFSDENKAEFLTKSIRGLFSQETTPTQLLSQSRRTEIEQREHHWREVRSEFRAAIRFHVCQGDLPNGSGKFRIHVWYFALPGGPSLKFLRVNKAQSGLAVLGINKGFSAEVSLPIRIAWKGMQTMLAARIQPDYHHRIFAGSQSSDVALIEIDFSSCDAGRISVSRNAFIPSKAGVDSIGWARRKALQTATEFARENQTSKYAWLNKRILKDDSLEPEDIWWLVSKAGEGGVTTSWESLRFPLVSASAFAYWWRWGDRRKVSWKNAPVLFVPCLGGPEDDDPYDGPAWNLPSTAPDYVVQVASREVFFRPTLAPLWTRRPKSQRNANPAGIVSRFPPNWRHICGVQFERYSESQHVTVWNPQHPLLRSIETAGWEWCLEKFESTLDPLPLRGELLSNLSRAASWILQCLTREQYDIWEGLPDRDPDFLKALWAIVSPSLVRVNPGKVPGVFQWVESFSDSRMRYISPTGWVTYKNDPKLKDYLPIAGPDWILKVE